MSVKLVTTSIMKILLILTGKTTESYLKEGIDIYLKRLSNYVSVSLNVISTSSIKDRRKAIEEESRNIKTKLIPGDFIVVLDEKGKEIGSRQLSALIEKWMVQGIGRVVFIIGGPFGISSELKENSNYLLSVSQFTFTHQMVRLILVEQLYRAMTIVKNESYHHD